MNFRFARSHFYRNLKEPCVYFNAHCAEWGGLVTRGACAQRLWSKSFREQRPRSATSNTPPYHLKPSYTFTMASLFRKMTTDADAEPSSSDKPDNKQRVLVLSSRGVTFRHRHLLNDLVALLPHSRKDAKLDTKSQLHLLNEVAELYNCNGVLFFEARKRQDLYMWLSRVPNGPCVKFHVQNCKYYGI